MGHPATLRTLLKHSSPPNLSRSSLKLTGQATPLISILLRTCGPSCRLQSTNGSPKTCQHLNVPSTRNGPRWTIASLHVTSCQCHDAETQFAIPTECTQNTNACSIYFCAPTRLYCYTVFFFFTHTPFFTKKGYFHVNIFPTHTLFIHGQLKMQ